MIFFNSIRNFLMGFLFIAITGSNLSAKPEERSGNCSSFSRACPVKKTPKALYLMGKFIAPYIALVLYYKYLHIEAKGPDGTVTPQRQAAADVTKAIASILITYRIQDDIKYIKEHWLEFVEAIEDALLPRESIKN